MPADDPAGGATTVADHGVEAHIDRLAGEAKAAEIDARPMLPAITLLWVSALAVTQNARREVKEYRHQRRWPPGLQILWKLQGTPM